MSYTEELFLMLNQWGVIDILLPFFLIFTLIFATLQKVKILGEGKKNFNVIVALIISIVSVSPHALNPGGPGDIVVVINSALPSVSLVAVALIMVFFLIGLFGVKPKWGSGVTGFLALVAFLFVGYIFLASANIVDVPSVLDDPELVSLVVIIIVFGGLIAFITGGDGKDKDKKGFFKSISDSFE